MNIRPAMADAPGGPSREQRRSQPSAWSAGELENLARARLFDAIYWHHGEGAASAARELYRLLAMHGHLGDCAEQRYRADGWPLCPSCGEDELYSLQLYPKITDQLACYRCGWSGAVKVVDDAR